jgi:hypothetical protein
MTGHRNSDGGGDGHRLKFPSEGSGKCRAISRTVGADPRHNPETKHHTSVDDWKIDATSPGRSESGRRGQKQSTKEESQFWQWPNPNLRRENRGRKEDSDASKVGWTRLLGQTAGGKVIVYFPTSRIAGRKEFLAKNSLQELVKSHEFVEGDLLALSKTLVTVWSPSNYGAAQKNRARRSWVRAGGTDTFLEYDGMPEEKKKTHWAMKFI